MIDKNVIESVKLYSFVDEVIKRGVIVYIYYSIDGKRKQKHLPLRSSVKNVQMLIAKIKKELGEEKNGRTKTGNYYIA